MNETTTTPKRIKEDDPDAFMQRAKEQLAKQREEILAKREAIDTELAEIDAKINRVEAYFNPVRPTAPKAPKPRATTGTRRPRTSGVRESVFAEIAKHGEGISRKDLLSVMGATDDKAKEQSVSNAVSALKKDGKITGEQGHYKAV